MKCGKCGDSVHVENECVTCVSCLNKFHFDCSVREVKWRNMSTDQKNNWSCLSCKSGASASRKNSASSIVSEDNATPEEDVSTKTLLLRMNARLDKLDDVQKTVNGVSASIQFLSTKYDELLSEIKSYKEENKKLNKEVQHLKAECAQKSEELSALTKRFNALEQYGRGVNLEVHGVEVTDGESAEHVVQQVAQAIGVTYSASEIQAAHRLPRRDHDYTKPPVFLIQFLNKRTKQKWLQFGRRKKDLISRDVVGEGERRVYINENLTPYYSKLFWETKKLAKERNYQYVWLLNGSIRVKKSDTSRQTLIIACEDDLNKLV